jgi:nucleotide-binding universal stress UspA family protein
MNESLQHIGPESKGVGSSRGPVIELNNILAPVDFSRASQRGIALAAGLAVRFHSKLDLLYVVEPPVLPEWGYVHLTIRDAKLRHTAEERLPQFVRECGIDPGLVRSAKVRAGEPESQICRAAVEENADLIVLASHGLGGLKHAFIGSTSAGVVRRAPCPVLTVRERALGTDQAEQAPFAPRRILVTTDFSEASKKAFPYAAALARKFEASLTLLYVVPSHLPAEFGHLGIVLEENRMLAEARERLPRFREMELNPHVHVETLVSNGSPAHAICTTAETQSTDLIVISTRGHTGLKRFALGSVTENVVRHAPCPVLVVREREHEFLCGG